MQKNNINEFFKLCDEMINEKFIMSYDKISKILKVIANDVTLYGMVEDCLKGFNFDREYKSLVRDGKNNIVNFEDDDKKRIAFIFCLFVEVDNKRIDFYEFLTSVFSSDKSFGEYEKFVNVMLKPFKESAIKLIKDEENLQDEESSERDKSQDKYKEMSKNIMMFQNEINLSKKISGKKKIEYNEILSAIRESLKYKNQIILNALFLFLSKSISREKSVLASYEKLMNEFMSLYK